jgi:hypothetical protein
MAEVESRIHKVLDLGINLNTRAGTAHFQDGVASARVSTLGPVLVAYAILSIHCAHGLAQGLGGSHGKPRDADPPEGMTRQGAEHSSNEKTCA